jgi:hypothetical protein
VGCAPRYLMSVIALLLVNEKRGATRVTADTVRGQGGQALE